MSAPSTACLGLVLGLSALHIAAAVDTPPSLMSRTDHALALRSIREDGRLALARCRALPSDEARLVCRAEARANERIALAALEARYRGTLRAQEQALREQARALHAVAEARRLVPAT
jgi:hypothetical protein